MTLEALWDIIDAKKTLQELQRQTSVGNAMLLWLLASLKTKATNRADQTNLLATESSDSPLAAIAKDEKLVTFDLASNISDHYSALGPNPGPGLLASTSGTCWRSRHGRTYAPYDNMENPPSALLIHYLLNASAVKPSMQSCHSQTPETGDAVV